MAPGDGVNQIGFASVLAVAHKPTFAWQSVQELIADRDLVLLLRFLGSHECGPPQSGRKSPASVKPLKAILRTIVTLP